MEPHAGGVAGLDWGLLAAVLCPLETAKPVTAAGSGGGGCLRFGTTDQELVGMEPCAGTSWLPEPLTTDVVDGFWPWAAITGLEHLVANALLVEEAFH